MEKKLVRKGIGVKVWSIVGGVEVGVSRVCLFRFYSGLVFFE